MNIFFFIKSEDLCARQMVTLLPPPQPPTGPLLTIDPSYHVLSM